MVVCILWLSGVFNWSGMLKSSKLYFGPFMYYGIILCYGSLVLCPCSFRGVSICHMQRDWLALLL